jgi:hypothetical protein
MAYLYRHVRLDKNEPFYIGIAKDEDKKYKRAYSKYYRNKYWHNVIELTQYEVEILLINLTWEEACQKEIEFIKLYGRKDLKLGSLVNMTNGGEGNKGPRSSEHSKKLGKNPAIGPQPNRRVSKPKLKGRTPWNKGKKYKLGKRQQVKCSYCNIEGSKAIMLRWHFENCKYK